MGGMQVTLRPRNAPSGTAEPPGTTRVPPPGDEVLGGKVVLSVKWKRPSPTSYRARLPSRNPSRMPPLHPGVDTPAVRGGGVGFGGAHLAGAQQSAEPGEEPVVGLPGDRPREGLVDAFGDHGPVLVHSASGEGTSPTPRSTVRIRRWLVSAIVVSGRR